MAYLPNIDLESETAGESNYGNITLLFIWDFRPQRIISTSICPLSKLCRFLRDSHLENLDFHQKPIFVRVVGTKRKGVEG